MVNDITIGELPNHLSGIHQRIRDSTHYHFEPIMVTIECNDPRTRAQSIIDLPGTIGNDNDNQDQEVKRRNVQGLLDITKAAVADNAQNDTVVIVNNANWEASSGTLYEEIKSLGLDPERKRLLAVLTHMDEESEKLKNPRDAASFLSGWASSFDNEIPYALSLHHLEPDDARSFADKKHDIETQLEEKQRKVQVWAEAMFRGNSAILPNHKHKFDLEALKTELKLRRDMAFEKNLPLLVATLGEMHEAVKAQQRDAEQAFEAAQHQNVMSNLEELLHDFVDTFETSWSADQISHAGHELLEGYTLQSELDLCRAEGYDPFEFPQEVPSLRVKLAERPQPDAVIDNTEFHDVALNTGAARVDRLVSFLTLYFSAVSAQNPSFSDFVNNAPRLGSQTAINMNVAPSQIVTKVGMALFVTQGCPHIERMMRPILTSQAAYALEVTRRHFLEKGHLPIASHLSPSSALMNEFTNKVHFVLMAILRNAIDTLAKSATTLFRTTSADLPRSLETLGSRLYGFGKSNDRYQTNTYEIAYKPEVMEEIPRLGTAERIQDLGRRTALSQSETHTNTPQKPSQPDYDKALYMFKRQLSGARELFIYLMKFALHGNVTQLIIGPADVKTFYKALREAVFYDVDSHGKARLIPRDQLEVIFGWHSNEANLKAEAIRLRNLEEALGKVRSEVGQIVRTVIARVGPRA
eukprot:TRINITY_DN6691_c0_g1_i2.p1 TRINITY_DN6691_c0_g1~~TRINITY_DN6691_c0_g1_i2.p1  ORF type:complete len:695 (-),score=123.39 TRINITY_DN6691_c0_g1_i2:248-2332(-)